MFKSFAKELQMQFFLNRLLDAYNIIKIIIYFSNDFDHDMQLQIIQKYLLVPLHARNACLSFRVPPCSC